MTPRTHWTLDRLSRWKPPAGVAFEVGYSPADDLVVASLAVGDLAARIPVMPLWPMKSTLALLGHRARRLLAQAESGGRDPRRPAIFVTRRNAGTSPSLN